jgi:hypothetical protein
LPAISNSIIRSSRGRSSLAGTDELEETSRTETEHRRDPDRTDWTRSRRYDHSMAESERGRVAPPRRRAASPEGGEADGARDLRGGVLTLQALAGNRAVTRLLARSSGSPPATGRTSADVVRDLDAVGRDINDARTVANDLIMQRGGARPGTIQETLDALRGLAEGGDAHAAGLV